MFKAFSKAQGKRVNGARGKAKYSFIFTFILEVVTFGYYSLIIHGCFLLYSNYEKLCMIDLVGSKHVLEIVFKLFFGLLQDLLHSADF